MSLALKVLAGKPIAVLKPALVHEYDDCIGTAVTKLRDERVHGCRLITKRESGDSGGC